MRTGWGITSLLLAVAVSGCRHGATCWPYPGGETIVAGPPHAAPEGMTWQLVPNGAHAAPSAPSLTISEPPARFGAPTTEAPCPPAAPKTVFVRGPQQRIIIERDCPPAERKERAGAPTPPPDRAAAAVSAAQDVLLIPRTVYVPYVAQTPTRAARLVTPVAPPEEDRSGLPAPPPEKDRVGAPLPPPAALQP